MRRGEGGGRRLSRRSYYLPLLLPSLPYSVKSTRNMDDEERQVKPNSAFLGRLVGGVTRGNQRVIDSLASRAAQKVGGKGMTPVRCLYKQKTLSR